MILNSPDSPVSKAKTVMHSDVLVHMGKMVSLSDISVSKAKTVIISSNASQHGQVNK